MNRVSGFAACVVAHALLVGAAAAADPYATDSAYGIPVRLRASLEERLSAFVHAHADQKWEEVARLLGRYRGKSLYSAKQKECLLTQMKNTPINSFVHERTTFSSEIMSTPPEKRWWFLHGLASFGPPSASASRRVAIVAYLDQGEWYFTPPNYDDEWEASHITDADRAANYRSDLTLDIAPGCPVEIRDLHVKMDATYPSLRKVSFAVANRTSRKVTGYEVALVRVGERCFGLLSGHPTTIEPGGVSRAKKPLTYSAYAYWCEGVQRQRLVVDTVDFADGSHWHDPRVLRDAWPLCLR